MKPNITVDVCTKDRYLETLPGTLLSIANQTVKPDAVYIYDDSQNRVDMRTVEVLNYIFHLFHDKEIGCEVIFGRQAGQHHGHQLIQSVATDLVWRIDDDEIAEHDCLENLLKQMREDVGAVGGLVLMPGANAMDCKPNRIAKLDDNCQWHKWSGVKEVEHLYSSYLYRRGVMKYEETLSPVAHREETLHSYGIYKKGLKLLVTADAVTWHFRNSKGGIRTGQQEDWLHDERIFQDKMREYRNEAMVLLDCGKGDHLVFKSVLPKIKEKYSKVILAVTYPDVFPDEECISIADGKLICDPFKYNISRWCIDNKWDKELRFAYAEMYGVKL